MADEPVEAAQSEEMLTEDAQAEEQPTEEAEIPAVEIKAEPAAETEAVAEATPAAEVEPAAEAADKEVPAPTTVKEARPRPAHRPEPLRASKSKTGRSGHQEGRVSMREAARRAGLSKDL